MTEAEQLGNRIRNLRKQRNLSQQELADLMVVSRAAIANWESGNRLPDLSMLTRMSRCLGIEPFFLLDALGVPEHDVHILVVEDAAAVLSGFVRMIENELPSVQVSGFEGAAEALGFARENRVDIAFLDMELNDGSGLSLSRQLSSLNPCTNIIYLASSPQYMPEALNNHCSGYIMKPLTPKKIRHEITNLRHPIRGLSL